MYLKVLCRKKLYSHNLNKQQNINFYTKYYFLKLLLVLNGGGTDDVFAPVEVLRALKRHGWMVSSGEQDAHELFNVIVSTLQEESNKAFKVSKINIKIFITNSNIIQSE